MVRPTKSFKSNKTVVDEIPTTELHIDTVAARTDCVAHEAPFGFPCWSFQGAEHDNWHFGICNARAKRAGFNGTIHPSSLDRTFGQRARA